MGKISSHCVAGNHVIWRHELRPKAAQTNISCHCRYWNPLRPIHTVLCIWKLFKGMLASLKLVEHYAFKFQNLIYTTLFIQSNMTNNFNIAFLYIKSFNTKSLLKMLPCPWRIEIYSAVLQDDENTILLNFLYKLLQNAIFTWNWSIPNTKKKSIFQNCIVWLSQSSDQHFY